MKILIGRVLTVIFIATSTFMYAQEVAIKPPVELFSNEIDEFTGTVKKSTRFQHIGGTSGATFFLMRADDQYVLAIRSSSQDIGCAGADDNYIIFLFEDGTVLRLDDDFTKIKCGDKPSSYYNITGIKFKPIKKIRLRQTEGSIDVEWTGIYSMQELIDALK